jgi:hypothetical protein
MLSMANFDKIRYKTHIGEGMHGMADAVRRYDEIYTQIISSAELATKLISHIDEFYEHVIEQGTVDPAVLKQAFMN